MRVKGFPFRTESPLQRRGCSSSSNHGLAPSIAPCCSAIAECMGTGGAAGVRLGPAALRCVPKDRLPLGARPWKRGHSRAAGAVVILYLLAKDPVAPSSCGIEATPRCSQAPAGFSGCRRACWLAHACRDSGCLSLADGPRAPDCGFVVCAAHGLLARRSPFSFACDWCWLAGACSRRTLLGAGGRLCRCLVGGGSLLEFQFARDAVWGTPCVLLAASRRLPLGSTMTMTAPLARLARSTECCR
mmetsp:Transcript_19126/g.73141  ORF Transcript_19126/g.73141 Transcript_19126/m.73141 type:complete len:244 (+) Transcript_19126:1914-2645(+)